MSLFPNVGGQSVAGEGLGSRVTSRNDCRYAFIAGQSAALRTSFQFAAAYVRVADT